MLQQICDHIHNYFIKAVHDGRYEIAGGMVSLSFMKDGQRFCISGSDLNDGIYTYHADGIKNDDDTQVAGLQDETFTGTICVMAVPPAVVTLSGEITEWVEKYGAAVKTPYSSENVIGVYSYEKMTASKVGGGNPFLNWQDVFKSELNRWRKVSF